MNISRRRRDGLENVSNDVCYIVRGRFRWLGVNYEVFDGMQLIGEVTPVSDGRDPTWALGARYDLPNGKWSIDATATNAPCPMPATSCSCTTKCCLQVRGKA